MGILGGGEQFVLQAALVLLDDLIDLHMLHAGEIIEALIAPVFVDVLRHRIAPFLAERLGEEIVRLEDVRISRYEPLIVHVQASQLTTFDGVAATGPAFEPRGPR